MSTSENKKFSHLNGNQSNGRLSSADEFVVAEFFYSEVKEVYLRLRAVDDEGYERPTQSLANEESIIGSWLIFLKRSPSDAVGEELGIGFNKSLSAYLADLKKKKLSKRTINDRKSIIKKFRECFLELQRTIGLPENFSAALNHLAEKVGLSPYQLSRKTDIRAATLQTWMQRNGYPSPNSLMHIRKLERFFRIPTGTLSSKLPDAFLIKVPFKNGKTPWRAHQRELMKLRYRLTKFPSSLQGEWVEVILFFTNFQWASERGLKRNSTWRIRWNTNQCVTADIHYGSLRSFFGYLCLPVDAPDKRIAGLGFRLQDLTLALLTDADLVINFLRFMKGRSVSDSFNNETVRFLGLCMMLIRNGTGYLRQRPEFGAKLPQPVSESDWPLWCEDNFSKLKEFKEKITGVKKSKDGPNGTTDEDERVRMTRNTFESVIDIIKERQHPLSALFDLAGRLESLIPLMEGRSKESRALHHRSIFHVRLISSNPLRSENFSMMRFVPRDHASFEEACERFSRLSKERQTLDFSKLYVETTTDSNLYQKKDGSWRLQFKDRDFKNERGEDLEHGVRNSAYDVEIVPSVWPSLTEYLFRHRQILNLSIRDRLRMIRAERDLPSLTPEEERAIIQCPFVFRGSTRGMYQISSEKLLDGYGTGQMPAMRLSLQILSLTSRYLPESKGFSANACRHLVATEYIKNERDGWEVAAVALHNTVAVLRKYYAWLEIGDLIKPWNSYYERLKERYDQGDI